MILQKIEYNGFRNLVDNRLEFSDQLNLIIGPNGAGKTNLLEAIFFSAYTRSFRTNDERNLLKFNEPSLRIQAKSDKTEANIFYNGEKRLTLGGVEKNRLSEFIGWLAVCIFSLDDVWILRGTPSRRRAFLDWLISKLNPNYLVNLSEYRRILRQRNCLLQMDQTDIDIELLNVINEQMIHYGNEIYKERGKIIPVLKEKFVGVGQTLGLNGLDMEYRDSTFKMQLDLELLKEREPEDIKYKITGIGPHRDDILIIRNRRPIKDFGSDGEVRLSAIALKIAESEILQEKLGGKPILLLDEAASELDQKRKEALFDMLSGQIFYATVNEDNCTKKMVKKRFFIQGGQVEVS
ncbi:MAG: DNA replication and repair protein RecF [candidate division WOR-3 bacterium]